MSAECKKIRANVSTVLNVYQCSVCGEDCHAEAYPDFCPWCGEEFTTTSDATEKA